jgi:sulfoxide reductase heme-binding subunit YedZ
MSNSALWYVGRGVGLVTLVLFTLTLVLGIVTRSGRRLPGLPRYAVTAVHRSASLLSLVFLAVHVLTLTLDPLAQLRWYSSVIPFTAGRLTVAISFAAIAVDITLAVIVTSLLRTSIGPRTWKVVHWAAYAMWPLAVGHVLLGGTDRSTPWLLAVLALCVAAVVAAVIWRLSPGLLDESDRTPGTLRPQRTRSLVTGAHR